MKRLNITQHVRRQTKYRTLKTLAKGYIHQLLCAVFTFIVMKILLFRNANVLCNRVSMLFPYTASGRWKQMPASLKVWKLSHCLTPVIADAMSTVEAQHVQHFRCKPSQTRPNVWILSDTPETLSSCVFAQTFEVFSQKGISFHWCFCLRFFLIYMIMSFNYVACAYF